MSFKLFLHIITAFEFVSNILIAPRQHRCSCSPRLLLFCVHCITLHDMTCCSLHFAALAVAQHVQTKTLNSSWLRELGRGFALMQHRWALRRPLSASSPPMRRMQLRPTGWRAKSAEDTSNQRLLRTTTAGFACLTGT